MAQPSKAYNYKATVSYDGSAFHGMAVQPRHRTVTAVLNDAISNAFGTEASVKPAGRTDAGVHALGQVVAFKLPYLVKPYHVVAAINGRLPPDVRIVRVMGVPATFDPRHDAKGKVYRYVINTGRHDPLTSRFVYQLGKRLDIAGMRSASRLLLGTHDFLSFSSETRDNTVRTLDRITIARRGHLVTLTFEGRAFLRYMVRMLVGTLVDVGLHQADEERVRQLLANPKKGSASRNAPPNGLTLVRVRY